MDLLPQRAETNKNYWQHLASNKALLAQALHWRLCWTKHFSQPLFYKRLFTSILYIVVSIGVFPVTDSFSGGCFRPKIDFVAQESLFSNWFFIIFWSMIPAKALKVSRAGKAVPVAQDSPPNRKLWDKIRKKWKFPPGFKTGGKLNSKFETNHWMSDNLF